MSSRKYVFYFIVHVFNLLFADICGGKNFLVVLSQQVLVTVDGEEQMKIQTGMWGQHEIYSVRDLFNKAKMLFE